MNRLLSIVIILGCFFAVAVSAHASSYTNDLMRGISCGLDPAGTDPAEPISIQTILSGMGIAYDSSTGSLQLAAGGAVDVGDFFIENTGFSHRIVSCVKGLLYVTTRATFSSVRGAVASVVITACLLYFIFFFVRVLLSGVKVQDIRKELSITIITIILVLSFSAGSASNGMLRMAQGMQEELVEMVFEVVSTNEIQAEAGNITYERSRLCYGQDLGTASAVKYGPWKRIDCMIAFIAGVRTKYDPNFTGPMPNSGSIFNNNPFNIGEYFNDMSLDPFDVGLGDSTLTSLFAAGGLAIAEGQGLTLLFSSMFVFALLITAVFQCVIIYLGALIAVSFLVVVAPICIPCYLFGPTKAIFNFWLETLMSFIFQPCLIIGYMCLMMNCWVYVLDGPEFGILKQYEDIVLVSKRGYLVNTTPTQDKTIYAPLRDTVFYCDENEGTESGCEETSQGNITEDVSTQVKGVADLKIYDNYFVDKEWKRLLLMNQMILILFFLVTLAFMENVLAFGAELAGMSAASVGVMNIHEKAMSRLGNLAKAEGGLMKGNMMSQLSDIAVGEGPKAWARFTGDAMS